MNWNVHSQFNIQIEQCVQCLLWKKRNVCHFTGCEQHREDLAKPWPGYPASPSTQCARGTQIGTTPTQVQGKCSHGAALSFPNQLRRVQWQQRVLCLWAILMGMHISIRYESAYGGGSSINPQASAPSAERKKLPFMATDHRLKPLATKPTNEALSVVAGQWRKRSREIWPSPHPCMNLPSASLLFLLHHSPPHQEKNISKHAYRRNNSHRQITTVTCSRIHRSIGNVAAQKCNFYNWILILIQYLERFHNGCFL